MIKNLVEKAIMVEAQLEKIHTNEASEKIQAQLEKQVDEMLTFPHLREKLTGSCEPVEVDKLIRAYPIMTIEVIEGIKYIRSIKEGERLGNLSWILTLRYNKSPEYWLKSWDVNNSILFQRIERELEKISEEASEHLREQRNRLFQPE